MTLRSGFTLGNWEVYPLEGRLSQDGQDRRVQPKSMEVLLCLAEAAGEVVERNTLLTSVWGERAVTDEPLTRCIGELRRALGDSRAAPDYIVTIPKRGYQLVQPVVPKLRDRRPLVTTRSKSRDYKRTTLAAGFGIVLAALALFVISNGFLDRQVGADRNEISGTDFATRSIVVLPFVDMSVSGDQEYMSDGIAEELLNVLAKIRELRVISRTSAFSFKGKSTSVREIAAQLDVAFVLEGSVRTSGDRIRVTTQLIDARTDTHIWSETYDRQLEDIFSIQDDIAAAVVGKLELTLLADTPKTRATDPEAYSLYLQARYLHEHTGGDSFLKAFDFYKAALEIDEHYVPAWVWLAALYDDTVNSSGLSRGEVGRLARDAIDRALAIDSSDPLALGMSGILLDAWDNDIVTAAARMQQALELDPKNPTLLRWSAILLVSLGRYDEAVEVNEYLFEHDPIGSISKINLASTYLMAGRFDDAIRICEINVALNEGSGPCQSRLIYAYLRTGNPEFSLKLLEDIKGSRVYVRLAPMVLHALDRPEDFDAVLADLQQAYEGGDKGMAYWLGVTYATIGNNDTAMRWFERAADDGVLRVSPNSVYYTSLEDDPRWHALMARIGRTADVLRAIELDVVIPRS